jgi:hypothetical protein
MQIVEVTDFAVRSAVLHLTRRDTPLRFEVFPMVHVGEPAFYAAVAERLRRADLIIAEGIGAPEPPTGSELDLEVAALHWPGLEMDGLAGPRRKWDAASALTASYQIPVRSRRIGLIEDNIDYRALGVPVLYPDMTDDEFAAAWRDIPGWQRTVALAAFPLYGLHLMAFGSRHSLARGLEVNDTDWYERRAAAATGPGNELLTVVGEKRDRLLMTALEAVHDTCAGEAITVAVVYGAMHVPPITNGLRSRHDYSVRSAEWLTVFGLEQPRP